MMKKVLAGVLALILLLPIGTTNALAANQGQGRNFVDEDGDGICDNYQGRGKNFVDEDGDGICDNYADGRCMQNGNCMGNGNGNRNGKGNGNANRQGKNRNNRQVSTSKSKVSLKKGRTYRLNTKTVSQNKKQKNNKVYYESSNKKVATVSQKGVIKAKKKGKCTVYAYAQDGTCKKVKVTVP